MPLLAVYVASLVIITAIVVIIELSFGTYLFFIFLIPNLLISLLTMDSTLTYTTLFYIILLIFNYLAILCLSLTLLSGYFEKWISYEMFSVIALCMIVGVTAYRIYNDFDPYSDIIIKKVYERRIKGYTPESLEKCVKNLACIQNARFHERFECCGWNSPNEYINSTWNLIHTDNSTLPSFCCKSWYSSLTYPYVAPPINFTCRLESNEIAKNFFNNGCKAQFQFQYESFNPSSYRYGILYPIFKSTSVILFLVGKEMKVIPRGEGAFAHKLPRWSSDEPTLKLQKALKGFKNKDPFINYLFITLFYFLLNVNRGNQFITIIIHDSYFTWNLCKIK